MLAARYRLPTAVAVLALAANIAPALRAAQTASLPAAVRLFDQGRYAEARTTLAAVTRSEPRAAEAWYYLGRIALVDGDGEGSGQGARARGVAGPA